MAHPVPTTELELTFQTSVSVTRLLKRDGAAVLLTFLGMCIRRNALAWFRFLPFRDRLFGIIGIKSKWLWTFKWLQALLALQGCDPKLF
jgi:hypothetical protein